MVGESLAFAGRVVRVIDLSQRLSNATSAFEPMPHAIEYFDHTGTVAIAEEKFGLGADHWRDGLAWAHERVTLTTHSGTHLDAHYHYHPTSDGRPARTIDEVPFRWLMGDGVVLDVMADEARAGDDAQLWESHKFGADDEYLQIEKLSNLAALPRPFGFQVLALPIRLERASGAWARVVALVPGESPPSGGAYSPSSPA